MIGDRTDRQTSCVCLSLIFHIPYSIFRIKSIYIPCCNSGGQEREGGTGGGSIGVKEGEEKEDTAEGGRRRSTEVGGERRSLDK